MRVAFQGERGAYSEEAVIRHFGPDVEPVPCRSFAEVFASVSSGKVDRGLVPVENSLAGSIHDNYDLLRQHDLFVIGEVVLPVNHYLLALPGVTLEEITRVYSHPQALAQCDRFIAGKGLEAVAFYDTAGSAKMLREEGLRQGAIASRRAGELYDLNILAESIQSVPGNFTRFLALSTQPAPYFEGPAKTALVLMTAHQPGALYRSLGALATRGLNLTKLESRPARNSPWEYIFYLDFEGHREDAAVREALSELAATAHFLKVLGSFAKDPSLI